jgi:hypothetical protein
MIPREKAVTASMTSLAAEAGLRMAAATAVSPTVIAMPGRGGWLRQGDSGASVPPPAEHAGSDRAGERMLWRPQGWPACTP